MLESLSSFLQNHLLIQKQFCGRTFYGETFALAFFADRGELTSDLRKILIDQFHAHESQAPHFHWEFNRYALLHYERITADISEHSFVVCGALRNTQATNWQLLKNCINYNSKEVKALIEKMQDGTGLIRDEPHVNSFHYHAFSLTLLAELYEAHREPFLLEAFLKGIEMIRPFILQNGEALMIGRGQLQLFGMGALLDALATAYQFNQDETLLFDFWRVWDFVKAKQRPDGSLPLVLRDGLEGPPDQVDLFDERYLGWYCYNNYFDYLPFFAYFANRAFNKINEKKGISYPAQNFRDHRYIKVAKRGYEAIVAKPGGLTTNDLPFPYIVANGIALTPLCGGEQFAPSPYLKENVSLPLVSFCKRTLRSKSISRLRGDCLQLMSPLGYMKRRYLFQDDGVCVQTKVISPFSCVNQFAFFDDFQQETPTLFQGRGCRILSSHPLLFLRSGVTATGKIAMYGTEKKNVTLKVLV